jgi:hypothetical protein
MRIRTDTRMREYRSLPLFAGCTDAQLRDVSNAAARLHVDAGTVLLRQGAQGRQFLIVFDGTADVWRDGRPIDEIGAGGHVGEIALIRRIREPVSIVARTAMIVDVVGRRDVIAQREFATLFTDLPLVRRRLEHELDERLARWIAGSDPRSPGAAVPTAVPTSTDDHHPAPEPASRSRFRRATARPMAVARCRRASR